MRLTGDPNRIARFGFDINTQKQRTFAFNKFAFPSCGSCNSDFGNNLEDKAAPIMTALLETNSIDRSGLEILLDWFDKVRIGLWLGFRYLNENSSDISPHFHIVDRMGTKDRVLMIYRAAPGENLLGFDCVQYPGFQLAPSCFLMRIRHYIFVNMSYDFLFSQRAGLPYMTNARHERQGDVYKIAGDLVEGSGAPRFPLMNLSDFPLSTAVVYQPITGDFALPTQRGPIFYETSLGTTQLKDETISLWQQQLVPTFTIYRVVAAATYRRLNRFLGEPLGGLEGMSEEGKRQWRTKSALSTEINEIIAKKMLT